MAFKFMVRPKRDKQAKPFEITVSGPHEDVASAQSHVEKFSPNLVIVSAVAEAPAAAPAPVNATPVAAK